MAKVHGIGAVMIYANDPERLAAWYTDSLGIPTYHDDRDGNYYGEIRDTETDAAVQLGIYRSPEPLNCRNRAMMINYRVEDLDEVLAELQESGVTVEETAENDYGRFAHIRDPEGNPIELWSEPA